MAAMDYNVRIKTLNDVRPGLQAAERDFAAFGKRAEGALKAATGFVGLQAVNAGLRTAASLVQAFKGDTDAARAALETLPLGLGPTIAAVNMLRDAFSGAKEAAEELAKTVERGRNFGPAFGAVNTPNFSRMLELAGLSGGDRKLKEMDFAAEDMRRSFVQKNIDLGAAELEPRHRSFLRQQLANQERDAELHFIQERARIEDESDRKRREQFAEATRELDNIAQKYRDLATSRQSAQDALAERIFAEDAAFRAANNRAVQLQARTHLNQQARGAGAARGGGSYPGVVESIFLGQSFGGHADIARSNQVVQMMQQQLAELKEIKKAVVDNGTDSGGVFLDMGGGE